MNIVLCFLMVPAAGLEPARIIHPPDFESGTSTNFITRGVIFADEQQKYHNMFIYLFANVFLHFLKGLDPK
jgi:hypothetical protein